MFNSVPYLIKKEIVGKGQKTNLMVDEISNFTSLVQGKNDCGGWIVPKEL